MMKKSDRKGLYAFLTALFVIATMTAFGTKARGEGKQLNPPVKLYESKDGFSMNSSDSVSSLSYGKQIGKIVVKGAVDRETTISGTTAYAASGALVIGYSCFPTKYQTKTKENWNLEKSDSKMVGDISLSKKVSNGTMIIQKSTDGKSYEDVCDPIQNLFSDKKIDFTSFLTANIEDINKGTYYRVIVAYEMRKKTGTRKKAIWTEDVFDYLYCVEEYDFYLCYSKNPISVKDLSSREPVKNNSSVDDGFMLDTNGANAKITVKRGNVSLNGVGELQTYTSPGAYTIDVMSPLGDSFQSKVKVSGGLSTQKIPITLYENSGKKGYTTDNKVSGNLLSSVMIGQKAGKSFKSSDYDGFNGYGITADNVGLYIRLLSEKEYSKSGWKVIEDDWGKKEKQTIEGVWTGTVASGALIVQKSTDGKNWSQIEAGRYANGLYTTDFYSNYSGNGDVFIYSPDGNEVLNGLYIRVLYAYEIKQIDGKDKKRCIEESVFYLCNDQLGAVTFHNLTAKDKIKEICGDDNEIELEMYEAAESMSDGAVTTNGFTIDTSLNPTVTYTVKKNGKEIKSEKETKYTETGRYEIELKSAVGTSDTVTLYVDRMSTKETLNKYFGNGFIEGKRIYSEEKYPTYEGGKTKCLFKSITDEYQPLFGEICNISTGKKTNIEGGRGGKSVDLNEPGEYVITLNNNPTYANDSPSGDNKVITFHFNLIAQGDAPGPKVNRQSLEKSIKESISGAYPKYYGLIYSSAAAGNITLAFRNREDAFQYAYNYEKGTVEEQKDGSYLYTGSFIVGQKTRYDSNWVLTDAINYFADQAIHEMYFDVSDESTYLTLKDAVLDDTRNLRTLELKRSVTVFADGQEELLTDLKGALPILNSRPYAFLTPGENGSISEGVDGFKFIKDKYECDSSSVLITDKSGKKYEIDYKDDVDKQLEQNGCPTGKVTIEEKNVYGDKASYDAIYFANGDNTANVTLTCYCNGQENNIVMSQADDNKIIEADAFSIRSISDELDPYTLMVIKEENGSTSSFVADQIPNGAWSDAGEYDVSVINRVGNKYSFIVKVEESEYATISFQGEGTGSFQPMIVKKGNKNVSLPVPKRYGYEFAGYSDETGTMFEKVITQIFFSGSKVLKSEWKSKKCKVILKDSEDNIIDTLSEDYGIEIEIPTPSVPKGYIFDGWLLEGERLNGNKLKIKNENDIILVASFVSSELISEEMDLSDQVKTKKSYTGFVVFIVSVLIGGVGVFIMKKKTIAKKK